MFQINSYVKEHFRTATFEIIWESSPFLNNVLGCSSNTLTGRDSVNQVFHKMLQNFLEHLIHLSKEDSLENNSFVSWCITIFRFVTTFLEKIYFKYIKNRSSANFIHMYLLFQKFLVQLCKKLYIPVICFAVSTS